MPLRDYCDLCVSGRFREGLQTFPADKNRKHYQGVCCVPELPEMQALSERLNERLAGLTLRRADLLGFSSLKTYAPSPDELVGRTLHGVGRRAKYLVWDFEGGDRVVLHLSRAGRLDVEDPPKKTKPRGSVARFVFGPGSAGLDGSGVGVLVREHGTQRKASWWVLAPGDDGPLEGLGPSRARTSSPSSSGPAPRTAI